MISKTNKIALVLVFTVMQFFVVFGFQQSEITRQNIAELRNNPLKYKGKIVRIIGWLGTNCYHGGRWVDSDDKNALGIVVRYPDSTTKSGLLVQRDDLFEKFWKTCPDWEWYNPCKKDIEVEIEGFVEENNEAPKEWYTSGIRPGVLIVTRVIGIEEKYREQPPEFCLPEPPPLEEILKRVFEDIQKQDQSD